LFRAARAKLGVGEIGAPTIVPLSDNRVLIGIASIVAEYPSSPINVDLDDLAAELRHRRRPSIRGRIVLQRLQK